MSSDSADEGDTSEGFFTTAEGLQHLSIEGETVLNHLETILGVQNHDQESRENGKGIIKLVTYIIISILHQVLMVSLKMQKMHEIVIPLYKKIFCTHDSKQN